MKVAVVFIGTDKYLKFLPTWYESCEELLIPGIDKQYFIFTDGELEGTPDNMSVYPQEHLPWPYITLFRFGTILKAKEELENYDWVLFLDADMRVVNVVTEDDLFTSKPYIGVHHPCHYMQMPPHNEFLEPLRLNNNPPQVLKPLTTFLSTSKVVSGVVLSLKFWE